MEDYVLEGDKRGSSLYVHRQFIFVNRRTRNNTIYCSCKHENCFSTAVIVKDGGNFFIKSTKPHNHDGDQDAIELIKPTKLHNHDGDQDAIELIKSTKPHNHDGDQDAIELIKSTKPHNHDGDQDAIELIKSTKPHNHDGDQDAIELIKFKQELRRRSQNCPTPLKTIYEETCERFPETSLNVGFPAVESLMARARRSFLPPVPQSLGELAEILNDDSLVHIEYMRRNDDTPLFRAHLKDGNFEALVFISPLLGEALQSTRRMHVDATFKVLPRQLGAKQLLTIHGVQNGKRFISVYVMMTRKTTLRYLLVFEYVKNVLGELNPEVIMTDFEEGLRTALRDAFPNAALIGCWFQFSQSLFRRLSGPLYEICSTNPMTLNILKMLMVLPLLPPDKILEGLDEVKMMARENRLAEEFARLFRYIQNYWINKVTPEALSVFGQSMRTNNSVESFYHKLNSRIGGPHPSVYRFLGKLKDINLAEEREYRQILGDVQVQCTVSHLEGRLRNNYPLFEYHPQSPAYPAHLQRNEHEDQQDNQPTTPPEDLEPQGDPPSRPSCVVCLDEQPTRAVVPCGHCVCGNCANTL